MAATLTLAKFKKKMAGLFGDESGSAKQANDEVARMFRRTVCVDFDIPDGNTASLSLPLAQATSQPLRERVIYRAATRQTVKSVHVCQNLSSTVTATETMAWHMLILKRGGTYGTGTATNSYSLTTFIAGVSSGTDKAGTHSNSWSSLTSNTARYPNPCHLNSTAANLTLGKGDILTAQVLKGSGSANDSGAVFRGGQIIIETEEG